MNKLVILFFLGACFVPGLTRAPFTPRQGSIPFVVYFASRYRGICMGILISRTAVLTAAVCVTNPINNVYDTRPINVVTSTFYRHPRRGIRVQVTKVILPNLSNETNNRQYLMQKSAAVLILKRTVPDVLAEVPMRGVEIDYLSETKLSTEQECLTVGWHYFYKGDRIFPIHKFLLQRNLRGQFVILAKKDTWCEPLTIKFQKALTNVGFHGYMEKAGSVCIRDPERTAQPCHGMYGSPLICEGKVVGMLMAPDAQWSNCTGFSNIYHLFSHKHLRNFMTCISRLFDVSSPMEWDSFKNSLYEDFNADQYDYVPSVYDKVIPNLGSSSTETEYEDEE